MNTNAGVSRIAAELIEQARAGIRPEFLDSRVIEEAGLSKAVGAPLFCKVETENPVGSFKGRGADAFVRSLPPEVTELITASAGNFGLAMAYAGRRRGIAVTVYAARTASPVKIERIRAAGGLVRLIGRDFDEAKDHARSTADRAGIPYVEDGREIAITAGAGTIAMEITGSRLAVDSMLVPLGNGALLNGIGCWLRRHSRNTRIIGVCAEGAPAMAQSWSTHTLCSTPGVNTIADGIAVRVPVPEALADLQFVVDDMVLVSDDAIKRALDLVYRHLSLIAEPAGVAGVAALLEHPKLAAGVVCTPITGGNTTLDELRAWTGQAPGRGVGREGESKQE